MNILECLSCEGCLATYLLILHTQMREPMGGTVRACTEWVASESLRLALVVVEERLDDSRKIRGRTDWFITGERENVLGEDILNAERRHNTWTEFAHWT